MSENPTYSHLSIYFDLIEIAVTDQCQKIPRLLPVWSISQWDGVWVRCTSFTIVLHFPPPDYNFIPFPLGIYSDKPERTGHLDLMTTDFRNITRKTTSARTEWPTDEPHDNLHVFTICHFPRKHKQPTVCMDAWRIGSMNNNNTVLETLKTLTCVQESSKRQGDAHGHVHTHVHEGRKRERERNSLIHFKLESSWADTHYTLWMNTGRLRSFTWFPDNSFNCIRFKLRFQ